MELQTRRHRTVQLQDQENVYVGKGKVTIPIKKQGLTVRGALGDINTNVQVQREPIGKITVSAAEFEKKAVLNRGVVKSNYSHVQSKVDTGLIAKVQPTSRPPLRREESTASLAARAAVAHTRAAQSKPQAKENVNIFVQTKKLNQEKKTSKLTTIKEHKDVKSSKGLKDPTESLGKLKLVDSTSKSRKDNILINKVQPMLASLPDESKVILPKDIEDIDAGDYNSPLLMPVYIKDIYKCLTELEDKYAIEFDHLRKQRVVTGKMRATLIDWLVEVQQQFTLLSETFQITVGIIDRYLQAPSNVQRNQLQLVGVTAMFIASKYEEVYPPDVRDFVYVTDNAYTKSDIFQCERDILSKLGFCLARPIPLSFLRRFVKAANGTSKNHHLAKYFIDLSLIEYHMAHYKPSELAAAAICLSIYLLSRTTMEEVWTPTLSYYSGYSLDHVKPIIYKLSKIVLNVENSKHQSVYNKYLDVTLAKVSSLPQLKSLAIKELAEQSSP